MKEVAGYFIHKDNLLEGDAGFAYNYIMAGNGVYIHAFNDFLTALIPISNVEIRGLTSPEPFVKLHYGKIPSRIFETVVNSAKTMDSTEVYYAITWNGEYKVWRPVQTGVESKVTYHPMANTVVGLHSHPAFAGCFSSDDDRDEQGFRLDVVIGRLNTIPEVSVRVGVYGYFWPLPWTQVFEGSLQGIYDMNGDIKQEVGNDLPVECELRQNNPGRRWWNRILRR
ncbi:MAG: hypothetical protein WC364_10275 [Eubacteriales bacterium]|jgi:PRTRC genetic system protein A